MRTQSLLVLAVGVTLFSSAIAQPAAPAPKHWSAQWITAPGASQRDEAVLHFRKVIDVAAPPEHFFVNVSADNQFVFYVNQQRVGNGPSRSDLHHWRYETYDIAPMLRAGSRFGQVLPMGDVGANGSSRCRT